MVAVSDKDKNANQNRNLDRSKEERNNRRNRDGEGGERGPRRDGESRQQQQNGPIGEFNREDRPRRQGGQGGAGGQQGGNGGASAGMQRRGKREFDRQSGSDKTGVKAVDKRDGAGAHNWGSHKQDLDDLTKGGEYMTDGEKNDSAVEESGKEEATGEAAPAADEPKEMTLDEWKAQRQAMRAKPQYNLRKAGEGEDTKQFQNMVPLNKKKVRRFS